MTAKATLNGNITDKGGENCTSRGFDWDTDSGAPYANSWTENGSFSTGAFTHEVTGLPEGTLIYYRAKATNSAGTGYGGEESFTTWKSIAVSETGVGTESPAIQETDVATETGAGLDVAGADDEGAVVASDTSAGVDAVQSVNEPINASDTGGDAEGLALNDGVVVAENGAGTEITLFNEEALSADSGIGTETVLMIPGYFVFASDKGLGIDVAYLVQGTISLDEIALPHVLGITVQEPSILQDLLVMDALPYRKQRGKRGRSINLQGWTDSLTSLETLRAYNDGEKHLFMLPTGDSLQVHVTDVLTPEDVETYDRYDYTLVMVEVVD